MSDGIEVMDWDDPMQITIRVEIFETPEDDGTFYNLRHKNLSCIARWCKCGYPLCGPDCWETKAIIIRCGFKDEAAAREHVRKSLSAKVIDDKTWEIDCSITRIDRDYWWLHCQGTTVLFWSLNPDGKAWHILGATDRDSGRPTLTSEAKARAEVIRLLEATPYEPKDWMSAIENLRKPGMHRWGEVKDTNAELRRLRGGD